MATNYNGEKDLKVHLSMEYLDEKGFYVYKIFDLKIKPYDVNELVKKFKSMIIKEE